MIKKIIIIKSGGGSYRKNKYAGKRNYFGKKFYKKRR